MNILHNSFTKKFYKIFPLYLFYKTFYDRNEPLSIKPLEWRSVGPLTGLYSKGRLPDLPTNIISEMIFLNSKLYITISNKNE
jgi:hypothetical protein